MVLKNIFEEFRIALTYTLIGTFPVILIIFFQSNLMVIPLIEIFLCCCLTLYEDEVLLDIQFPDLLVRALTTAFLYTLNLYGGTALKDNFNDPVEFRTSDTWTIWLVICSLQYVRVAGVLLFYRICMFTIVFVLYILTYLLSTFD